MRQYWVLTLLKLMLNCLHKYLQASLISWNKSEIYFQPLSSHSPSYWLAGHDFCPLYQKYVSGLNQRSFHFLLTSSRSTQLLGCPLLSTNRKKHGMMEYFNCSILRIHPAQHEQLLFPPLAALSAFGSPLLWHNERKK